MVETKYNQNGMPMYRTDTAECELLELLIRTCRTVRSGKNLDLVAIAADYERRFVSDYNALQQPCIAAAESATQEAPHA